MTIEQDLIQRYKIRLTQVFKQPNPYIKSLFEKSEIQQKIKELQKINK